MLTSLPPISANPEPVMDIDADADADSAHHQFYQHPQHNTSSSSDDQYFSYSSDGSLPPLSGPSHYHSYSSDFGSQPISLPIPPPPPSTAASVPFQPSDAPHFDSDALFANEHHDAADLLHVEDNEQKPNVADLVQKDDFVDHLTGPRGANLDCASGSSLSESVSSNPLLRQDLHKNGQYLPSWPLLRILTNVGNVGTPKRPLNSFMIYSRWRRPLLQKEQPDVTASDLSKLLANEWRELPPDGKKRFQDGAKVVKKNFHNVSPACNSQ